MKKGGKKLEKRRFVVIVIGWLLVRPLFVEDALTNLHTTPFIGSIINIQTHWALLSLSWKPSYKQLSTRPLKGYRLSLNFNSWRAHTHTDRHYSEACFSFPISRLTDNRKLYSCSSFIRSEQFFFLFFFFFFTAAAAKGRATGPVILSFLLLFFVI